MRAKETGAEGRRELLLEWAREEGFSLAGIATPEPSEQIGFLKAWLSEGRHGEMEYLARPDAVERRANPFLNLPELRSILVVGHNYHQEDPPGVPEDPARGVIARYARGRDYHRVMKKALLRIHRRLEAAEGTEVPGRAYVDTGPILERELGMRAGLGWFGRNTMLIHPRKGSYYFLGCLLLGVEVTPDEPFTKDHCGSCHACLDACPTGALLGRDENGAPVMDARRCISYLTIENSGPIPRELRPLMGNRVYGCDICQEVCPFPTRFAEPAREPGYAARGAGERPAGVEPVAGSDVSAETSPGPAGRPVHPGTDGPSLVALLEMALSDEGWEAFSRGSAIRRAGRAGFARNVCVALGNWLAGKDEPPSESVTVLVEAQSDPTPLVRGHSAWALGQISSTAARSALERRMSVEEDLWVRREIVFALEGSRPTRR